MVTDLYNTMIPRTLKKEKNKVICEVENSRDEEQKSKKAMESLGSALHEVSAKAREAKENLLHSQPESESYDAQIEDLKFVLKATNEKYNSMLDEAEWEQREVGRRDRSVTMNVESKRKDEQEVKGWRKALKSVGNWLAHKDKDEWLKDMRGMLSLLSTVIATMTFQSALNPPGGVRPGNESGVVQCPVNKADNNPCPGESILVVVYPNEYGKFLIWNTTSFISSLAAEWEQREVQLVSCMKKNEEEKVSLEKEIKILLYLLKETEQEANAKREEKAQLKEKLKEVAAEAIQMQEALKETTAHNMKLKENLLDKEN
ncbi:hypothetical protein JHK84_043226 [Glycine max]|nr:hypothetical protein JHK86_043033 [Glycine max]KAG5117113.1 hypothetical protein JHK84_043226 [Glycine max]